MLQTSQVAKPRTSRKKAENSVTSVRNALQRDFDVMTKKVLDDAGEKRIRHLLQLIDGLDMVDTDVLSDSRAGYGSVVEMRDLDSGIDISYTLMAGALIDLDFNQVSLASPMGQAILGGKAGDEVVVITPHGKRRYKILAVETLPTTLGLTGAR